MLNKPVSKSVLQFLHHATTIHHGFLPVILFDYLDGFRKQACVAALKKSRRRGSNSRPTRYECVALPTELQRLMSGLFSDDLHDPKSGMQI